MIKQKNKATQVIISCFLAGCLEMYDFAIFGALATIIHQKYFNFMDSSNALIVTYALFAVGFVCRPIGALIFGYLGDKYGRKVALVTSVSVMGIASLSMCLMPSYESIGMTSCYLILLVRIMQGVSLGGEFSGGVIYAMEHFSKKRYGFVGSSVVAGSSSGILLATLVAVIVKNSELPEYSWRFAFLFGFGLSIIGFFIRQKLTETPEFIHGQKSKNKIPLIAGLKEYKLESLSAILLVAAVGSNLYFVVVYIPVYLKDITKLDLSYLPTITTLFLVMLSSFWGWKSDKVGREKLLLIGGVLNALYILVMLPLIMLNPTSLNIVLMLVLQAILFSILNGTANVFAVEIFPTKYRFSCYAFCQSIGMGVIGGTSPMIAALITKHSSNPNFTLGLYLCLLTLSAGVTVALTMKKQGKQKKLTNTNISVTQGLMGDVNPTSRHSKAI